MSSRKKWTVKRERAWDELSQVGTSISELFMRVAQIWHAKAIPVAVTNSISPAVAYVSVQYVQGFKDL